MHFSRREFAYCSLGAFSALSGCAGLSGESRVKVTKLKGINLDSEPHTLAVTLTENTDVVHESEHDLTAGSEQMEDGASFVLAENLPESVGSYELKAVLDSTTTERIDLASEYSGNNLQIIVDIDQQKNLAFYVNTTPL